MVEDCAAITTGIDKLLALITEHREITLTDAANQLQVDRATVDHWVDSLEEGGLITTKMTLRERYLFAHGSQGTSTRMKMLLRQMQSVYHTSPRNFNEQALLERQKEIKTMLAELKERVENLRHYEQLKLQVDEAKRSVAREQETVKTMTRDAQNRAAQLEKDHNAVLKERQSFADQQAKIDAMVKDIVAREQAIAVREQALATELKALQDRQREFERVVSQIVKLA